MSSTLDQHDRIALTIGRVCYWWSAIEILTRDMCHHLSAVINRAFLDPAVSSPIYILADNMDMRERVIALKTLACTALPLADFNRFESLLNRIDNEIRSERNRFVHDIWNVEENGIYRIKMGTRVQREQAFKVQPKLLSEKTYGSITEVEAFAETVEAAWRQLVNFDSLLANLVPADNTPARAARNLPE